MGELKDLPKLCEDLPKDLGGALNALPFAARGADPKLLPVVPVSPRDLAVSKLRFMIEAAPRLAPGELNAAVWVTEPLNPPVLVVGSTLMT